MSCHKLTHYRYLYIFVVLDKYYAEAISICYISVGYIGDERSTSEILNSEGWFKTGDLCYIDDDGFLYVLDRLKELIKYKGYQVTTA